VSKRILIVAAVVVLALGGGAFFVLRQLNAQAATASSLQTAQIERGTLTSAVNAAGSVAAPRSATVAWETSGVVSRVNVSVGKQVEAGEVLMELDPDSLSPAVVQAQADLLSAQDALDVLLAGPTEQQLANANLAIIQAQQAMTTAQRNLNSVMNPVSQTLLDQVRDARLALDTAQANQQLSNISQDVQDYNGNIWIVDWYFKRAQDAQAKLDANPGNQALQEAANKAWSDYQAQADKQAQRLLRIQTDQATKANATEKAQTAYDQAVASLQAAQQGPDIAKVELFEAQLDVAEANLRQAETDLAQLLAGPDAAEVAAARARIAAAQAVVNSTSVIAPFGGIVVAVENSVGDTVINNQAAVTLADLSSLEIRVDVSEVDINSISIGQEVNLTADAVLGQSFTGTVSEISILGTVQQGVVNYPVTVVIPDPDPALKPGMTAAVAIVTERHEDVLLVPNRAIRVSGGQRTVTVLFQGQQIAVPVTLGLSNETMTEIVDGQVQEGDTVVVTTTSASTANVSGGGFLFGDGPGGFGP
jgi:RND family efflux transporter MFP subunit